MKKAYLLYLSLISVLILGCLPKTPVVAINGEPNQFLVHRRGVMGVYMDELKKSASDAAKEHCKLTGQFFVEKYSIDAPVQFRHEAETTLFFGCTDEKGWKANKITGENPTDVYMNLTKLDELRKKGIINDAEFETQKKKILTAN